IVTTMTTAGRAVVFSGTAGAIGLAPFLFMPAPFMGGVWGGGRLVPPLPGVPGFGVGGRVIPLVSVVAALTFLPALLSLVGERLDRVRLLPRSVMERRADDRKGVCAQLARGLLRRPWP